jgi:peptide/nickel transport system substrate-binding protein
LFSYGGRAIKVLASVAIALTFVISGLSILNVKTNVEAQPETVLRMGFLDRIDSLNPYVGVNASSYIFYGLVYDSLFSVTNDMTSGPNLALSCWKVPETDPEMVLSGEPYGSVWEYNLTLNALWSDGEPFTADDVVFTFDLNTGSNYSFMWANQPYAYFVDHTDKVDVCTVRIHFSNPATGNPTPVAFGDRIPIYMMPKHKLESMSPFAIGYSWSGVFSGEDPPLVGTGPFSATATLWDDWIAGGEITLVRNPNYHWTADYGKTIQFDKIVMKFYDNETLMADDLKNGMLDVARFSRDGFRTIESEIDAGTAQHLIAFSGLTPTQHFTGITTNMAEQGPNLARLDWVVRIALGFAIDKSEVVNTNYLGLAEVGSTLMSPVSVWHYELDPMDVLPYDISLANMYLDFFGYLDNDSDGIREAQASSAAVLNGWVTEGTELAFELLVSNQRPEEHDIAQYLQYQWSQIGVQLNIVMLSEAQLWTQVYSYDYDMFIDWWESDPDPNLILWVQTYRAWNSWSDNKYSEPNFEENYSASVSALDPADRKTYTDACQYVHYTDLAYIVLAYTYQTYVWRDDTFDNWGDWAANPGRSIDAYWSGNPLYFDLVPIVEPIPEMPSLALPVLAVGLVILVAARRTRR